MMSVPTARSELIALAQEFGMRAPTTAVARTREGLRTWRRKHPFLAVLKTDESSGGRGGRIVGSPTEADHAWRALSTPPSPQSDPDLPSVPGDGSRFVPLRAVLSGEPLRRTVPVTERDVIALFPQEWRRDSTSAFLRTATMTSPGTSRSSSTMLDRDHRGPRVDPAIGRRTDHQHLAQGGEGPWPNATRRGCARSPGRCVTGAPPSARRGRTEIDQT